MIISEWNWKKVETIGEFTIEKQETIGRMIYGVFARRRYRIDVDSSLTEMKYKMQVVFNSISEAKEWINQNKEDSYSNEELEEMCEELIYQMTGAKVPKEERCQLQGHSYWQIGMYYLTKVNNGV
jgi:hypothetical protein